MLWLESFIRKSLKNSFFVNLVILFSFLLLSYLYIYVFLKGGYSTIASDRTFHLERLEEAYRNVKSGHVFSLISTFSESRIGQAIGTYYPSGNLFIYAIIRCILHKPITSLFAYIMVEKFLSLIVAYFSCKIITKRKDVSYLFSVLYTFSVYSIHNNFFRCDIGESWASIFIPMAFCGLYLILFRKDRFKGCLLISFGLASITYSHILSTIMTIAILFVVYLSTLSIQKYKSKSFKALVISSLIYFLASSGFNVPFINAILSNKINNPDVSGFGSSVNMGDLFVESLKNSAMSPNVGFILIIATIVGIACLYTENKFNKYIYIYGLVLLIISTSLFPWMIFKNTSINLLQFPWRLLQFAVMFLSLCVSRVVCDAKIKSFKHIVTLFAIILSISSLIQCHDYGMKISKDSSADSNPWYWKINNDNYFSSVSINRGVDNAAMYRDYLPYNSVIKADDIFMHRAYVNGKEYFVDSNNIESGYQSETFKLKGIPSKKAEIVLPFVIYGNHSYILTVNKNKVIFKTDSYSRILFTKPKGVKNIVVNIRCITPKYVILARYVSLIVILAMILLFILCESRKFRKIVRI